MANVTKAASHVAGKAKEAVKMASGYPGIFHHLMGEHTEVSTLMHRVMDSSPKIREELFPDIRRRLLAHAKGEEQEFYPKLKQFPELAAMIDRSFREHDEIEAYLEELNSLSKSDPAWNSQFEALVQAVEAHVDLEEHELFPLAKDLIDKDAAEKMLQRYEKVEEAAKKKH